MDVGSYSPINRLVPLHIHTCWLQHYTCCTSAITLQVTTPDKVTEMHSHLVKWPAYSVTGLPDSTDSLANVPVITCLQYSSSLVLCEGFCEAMPMV